MVSKDRQIVVVEDVRALAVAPEYEAQRPFKPKHRIFKKVFDRNDVRITISIREDGSRVVLDGQHARHFAITSGDYGPYLVEAFEGLSRAEEAAKFLSYNDRENVIDVDRFGPRVTAGEGLAVQINRVLESLGLRVAGGRGRYTVAAVSTLERVYGGAGVYDAGEYPDLLHDSLSTIALAWDGDKSGFNGSVILGLARLFATHGEAVDRTYLVSSLARTTPTAFYARAKELKENFGAASMAEAAQIVATGLYNQKKRTNKLPA